MSLLRDISFDQLYGAVDAIRFARPGQTINFVRYTAHTRTVNDTVGASIESYTLIDLLKELIRRYEMEAVVLNNALEEFRDDR